MFKIRDIQRESKRETKSTAHAAVVDLRVKTKKIEPFLAQPLRIQERQNIRPPSFREEKSQDDSARNSSGVLPRTFASLLVGFFLLNPFLDVYADELPLLPIEVTVAPVATSTPSELVVATSSPENIIPLTDMGTALSTTTENILPLSPDATSTEISAPIVETIPPPAETIASSTPIVEADTVKTPATITDEMVVADTETVTNTDVVAEATDTPPVVENTPTPEVIVPAPEPVKTEEAKPEPPKTEPVIEVIKEEPATSTPIVNVIEHKYLFRENECTRLDDGAFYCLPPETASTTTSVSNISLPRVFVEKDAKASGSKEIFFEDANGKVQVTNNNYDNDAPAYDKNSNLIVWHALIKGRMQIMLYDRNGSTAKQLTDTPYNNTDPKIHGKSVVWQGWANNNWEIFYIKDVTAEPSVIVQITTNAEPDMFPIISDGFITWQSFFGGSWRVFVYNLDNGQTSQISQPEAGKYENPRFALLFENRKENGEVETVGYDVASGKEIPINAPGTKPASQTPTPQGEKDKAVPVPAGGTASTSAPLKNPGKDDEGSEG